eukprot:tig00021332_g20336.t1
MPPKRGAGSLDGVEKRGKSHRDLVQGEIRGAAKRAAFDEDYDDEGDASEEDAELDAFEQGFGGNEPEDENDLDAQIARRKKKKDAADAAALKMMTEVEGEEEGPDDAAKKMQSDWDVPLEPFNLKREKKEGYFDEDGNYVEHRLKKDVRDAWLEEVEGEDEAQANPDEDDADEEEKNLGPEFSRKKRLAADKAKADKFEWVKRAKNLSWDLQADKPIDSDEDAEEVDVPACRRTILSLIKPGETVLTALRRLRGPAPAPGKAAQVKKRGGAPGSDFERLTEAADRLLSAGHASVYQDPYEKFLAAVRPSGARAGPPGGPAAGADAASGSDEPLWEYKWSEEGQEVFGPYKTSEMLSWAAQGYFANETSIAWVRQLEKGGGGGPFLRSDTVRFDLAL